MSSREESASKDVEERGAFTMQAMHQQFERLNFLFEEIKDRMNGQDAAIATLQRGQPQREPNVRRHRRRNPIPIDDFDNDNEVDVENDDFQASEVEMDRIEIRGGRRGRELRGNIVGRDRVDRNLESIKMKIPSFQGRNDPEAYLESQKRR